MGKKWTDEEIELVRELRGNGASTTQIAEALDRSVKGVQCKLCQLGLTQKHAKLHFGLENKRIVKAYYNMHSRCDNPNFPKFENHGGRGIRVCDEWSGDDGIANFYNWSLKNGYSDELSLDRIDNDGDYEPSNCRWTDINIQNENRRVTRYFEINGESKMAKDWCKEYGVNINTFWQRDLKGLTGKDLIAPPSYRTVNNTSGIVGVYKRNDTEKYCARIKIDKKNINLGNYTSLREATIARLNGEFKYLGFYTDNYDKALELDILTNDDLKFLIKNKQEENRYGNH